MRAPMSPKLALMLADPEARQRLNRLMLRGQCGRVRLKDTSYEIHSSRFWGCECGKLNYVEVPKKPGLLQRIWSWLWRKDGSKQVPDDRVLPPAGR